MKRYDDIIEMPHHVSRKHPQMSLSDRAAQFSPFAALTGYDDVIAESARCTDRKAELSEDEKTEISKTLAESIGKPIVITLFIPDDKKSGGRYEDIECTIKRFDSSNGTLILSDRSRVRIDDVIKVERRAIE